MTRAEDSVRVVFICTGNTCRSPMAAAAFKRLAKERGLNVVVDSAGMAAQDGDAVSPQARTVLKEHDLIPLRLRNQAITLRLVRAADLLITMTAAQQDRLEANYIPSRGKVLLLQGLVGEARDIPDPFGGTVETYERCFAAMQPALAALVERLA